MQVRSTGRCTPSCEAPCGRSWSCTSTQPWPARVHPWHRHGLSTTQLRTGHFKRINSIQRDSWPQGFPGLGQHSPQDRPTLVRRRVLRITGRKGEPVMRGGERRGETERERERKDLVANYQFVKTQAVVNAAHQVYVCTPPLHSWATARPWCCQPVFLVPS